MDSYFLTKRHRLEDLKAQLDQDYNSFYPQYRDLNDYFLPTRGRFVLSNDSNRGDRRNHKIIDPTGYLAARTLAAGMQTGITPPSRPWFRLSTPDPDLAEFGPVREWLDLVQQGMLTFLGRSNFYHNSHESYGTIGVFGTSAIFMDKDPETVSRFQNFPLGTYRIAKDAQGRVNVLTRDFRLTVRQLINFFGRNDEMTGKPNWEVFSNQVRKLYDRGQYETWVEVSHVIEPNEDYNPGALDAKFKAYGSCYFEKSTRDEAKQTDRYLRESGYDYFPVLVPRWQVTGMDVYGTDCPGMATLGDNKQLQHGEKRGAKALDKMVDPALKASAGLKGTKVSIVSGDITYLEDPNDRLEAVHNVNLDLNHLEQKQAQIRERIEEGFYVPLFMPLLNDDRNQRATAAEIRQIGEERLIAVGPVLERVNLDQNDPLIDNQFLLMNEMGFIPPAPAELQGQALKVEQISSIAQAQKMIGMSGMDRILQTVISAVQVDPSVVNKFDAHEYIDQSAEALGVSPRVIRSDEKVQEIMAQQAQAAAAKQKMESITALSGAAKNLSQADMSNDSALTRLAEEARSGQLGQQ